MKTFSIARREFTALVRTPTGWVVTALFALLTAIVFVLFTLAPGEPATLRYFFGPAAWLMVVVCPAISMRLYSEEIRANTLDALAAAPVADTAIVIGKYLGSLAFLAAMLLPTLVYPVALLFLSDPMPALLPVLSGYLGLLLAGGMYLAFGGAVSTLTSSQTLSFLATLIGLVVFMLATDFVAGRVPPVVGDALASASISVRVNTLARGVIEIGHVGFFAAISAGLLALSVASLQARRWA